MSTPAGPPYVELRPVAESDWRAVHGWASREEVCRYQGWRPNTEEQTRAFVTEAVAAADERPQHRFVYVVTCEGLVVGSCELNLRGDGQGEIGYGLHPDHWGRGLATAASRRLLELCFTERHPERARELTARHGVAAVDVAEAAARAEVLVVAVKPQDIDPLLAELATAVTPGTLVVSLCAGLPTSLYEQVLPAGTPVGAGPPSNMDSPR